MYGAVCCGVMQCVCVATCCSVVQCVAVCVAMSCSVLTKSYANV